MEDLGANIQEMMSSMMGRNKTKRRQVPIKEALEQFTQDEAAKLIDQDAVSKEALSRAENSGIVFLDEIDKIAKRMDITAVKSHVKAFSDILPIVEGTVTTKYGQVKTDHVLFYRSWCHRKGKSQRPHPGSSSRKIPNQSRTGRTLLRKELLRILKEPQMPYLFNTKPFYKPKVSPENLRNPPSRSGAFRCSNQRERKILEPVDFIHSWKSYLKRFPLMPRNAGEKL